MPDRRVMPRDRSYLGGVAACEKGVLQVTLDCLVRDLSRHGANVVFETTEGLQTHLEITIPRTGERHCAHIVWMDEQQAGVRFLPHQVNKVVSIETARLIKAMQAQHQVLARRIAQITGRPI